MGIIQKSTNSFTFQPPYAHRRYDFYKQRVPDYNSPDPRDDVDKDSPETQFLLNGKRPDLPPKALNFEEENNVNEADPAAPRLEISMRDLQEMERRKSKKRPSKNYLLEEKCDGPVTMHPPPDSDYLVEWEDVSQDVQPPLPPPKKYVFSTTGFNDKVKK